MYTSEDGVHCYEVGSDRDDYHGKGEGQEFEYYIPGSCQIKLYYFDDESSEIAEEN